MIARLEVTRGTLTEYPLAERVSNGWQNGVKFYADAEVTKVTPLIVAAGVQAEESDWEYGLYEEDPHRERERPHRAYNGAHMVSESRAHVEGQWRKGHPSIKFVRRRKAGPWGVVTDV